MWNGLPKAKYVIIWLLETRLRLDNIRTNKMSVVEKSKRKEKLKKNAKTDWVTIFVCMRVSSA